MSDMAGPCLSVLTRQEVSRDDEAKIRAVIDAISSKIEGDDFWIARQPFFVKFGEAEAEDQELFLDGWSPKGEVSFCAMCNGQIDHILLGVLSYRTAEILDGMIALGDLTTITRDPSVLTYDGRVIVEGYGYFGNASFLSNWMASPEFRLVK